MTFMNVLSPASVDLSGRITAAIREVCGNESAELHEPRFVGNE
jgi:hypothetical protein